MTSGPAEAMGLTATALRDGASKIIAIGGDGTANEVLNGFFESRTLIQPDAALGVISCGTGSDFARTIGWPSDPLLQAEQLAKARPQVTDVGLVTFPDGPSAAPDRYFLILASFGLSGRINQEVNEGRVIRFLGGQVAFIHAVLKTLIRHRPHVLRMTADGQDLGIQPLLTATVCNGRYVGGGMFMAPGASIEDGLLDAVTIAHTARLRVLQSIPKLYSGRHVDMPEVDTYQVSEFRAESVNRGDVTFVETDGDIIGRLPAVFQVVPRALQILR